MKQHFPLFVVVTFVLAEMKFDKMKKSVIALILVAFALTSCSYYTCATYAKKEKPPVEEETI